MKRVYLASRYSRFPEMQLFARDLEAVGLVVTSRWIQGDCQMSDAGMSEQARESDRVRFAQQDWDDLMAADICISFTEAPRSDKGRGGRHVEFGAAVAAGKRCFVVGHRENVFHCLPGVTFCESWGETLEIIRGEAAGIAAGQQQSYQGGRR